MEQKNQNINVTIAPDLAVGKYSNLAIIAHSKSEFAIDFATVLPGIQGAQVHSRIIMAPEHAKRLLMALQDNIQKYETQFGTIELGNQPAAPMPIAFGGEA